MHTVPTDNGIQFTTPGAGGSAAAEIRQTIAKGEGIRAHPFENACAKAGIDYRTTKPKHPWTNGQVERMNRTIKDATVNPFHYDDYDQLRWRHLAAFVNAYNFGRRLKTLRVSGLISSSANAGQPNRSASPSTRSSKRRD